MKKQMPSDKTKDMVAFSTQKPFERFRSIMAGAQLLQYGQSSYIRDFGMSINTAGGLLQFQGRVLPTPQLQYGRGSKEPTVVCFLFSWCMLSALKSLNFVRFQGMVNGTCECFLTSIANNVLTLWRADKKLVYPVTINHWLIVTFDTRRFRDQAQQDLIKNLVNGFRSTGKLSLPVAKVVY